MRTEKKSKLAIDETAPGINSRGFSIGAMLPDLTRQKKAPVMEITRGAIKMILGQGKGRHFGWIYSIALLPGAWNLPWLKTPVMTLQIWQVYSIGLFNVQFEQAHMKINQL